MENKDDKQKSYLFRDPVVERVVDQFVSRSDVERRKGVKNLGDYLQDVQEELMDAILYIQAAKEELMDTPPCKCNVKDARVASAIKWNEERKKTALEDLKQKMDKRKQVTYDRDNYGYVSDNT